MDLRAEVHDDEWVKQVHDDYTAAKLTEVDRALCDFAAKVTRRPWTIERSDVDRLRALGLEDRAIHDAVQVISFFNYINRVGDALGIDLEPEMPPKPASTKT